MSANKVGWFSNLGETYQNFRGGIGLFLAGAVTTLAFFWVLSLPNRVSHLEATVNDQIVPALERVDNLETEVRNLSAQDSVATRDRELLMEMSGFNGCVLVQLMQEQAPRGCDYNLSEEARRLIRPPAGGRP